MSKGYCRFCGWLLEFCFNAKIVDLALKTPYSTLMHIFHFVFFEIFVMQDYLLAD